jgi:hypothetical protein
LGGAPAAGLVEKAAVFRAAHEALNLLDIGAEEANLTDGQLRARVHALTREETWAPRFVADELAATHQQAQKARTDAAVWAARAESPGTDPVDAARLRAAAAAAARQAEELAERATALEAADEARSEWFAHTAVTRDNAHRARTELTARGINPDDPDDRVTATEWLEVHHTEQATDDLHREIRDEHDLYAPDLHKDTETRTDQASVELETVLADIRDTSTADVAETRDPAQRHRVPTADETAHAVGRAQVALAEITSRQDADALREAHSAQEFARRDQLARWATDDTTNDDTTVDDRGHDLARER